jgi:DNA helicase II / ATP-dependent DNA helicase PcrA
MENEYRIFGPPGTGKTTYLSEQIRKAAEKYGGERIIVSSFTKAAAIELVDRAETLGLPIPTSNIGTLHAHCYRAMGHPTIAESKIKEYNGMFPEFPLSAVQADVNESAADQHFESAQDEAFADYQIQRNRMTPREMWKPQTQAMAERWERFKQDHGYLDFTDLIEHAITTMPYPPQAAEIGIFDEVQDFTPLQLKLIRNWGPQFRFFLLAGDDDQTLYSFAGATPDAFLNPPIPPERKRILNQSYRVPARVQALAEMIIGHVKTREPKEYKPRAVDGVVVQGAVGKVASTWKRPAALVDLAGTMADQGKTVMILGACAYMLAPTLARMREVGLPFGNRFKRNRGDWNPLTPGAGVSMKERLLAFIEPCGPELGGVTLWSPAQLAKWVEITAADGLFKRGGKAKLQRLKTQEIPIPEYFDLVLDCFLPEGLDAAVRCDPEWLGAHVLGPKLKSFEFPMRVMASRGKAALNELPKVTIGTVHSVKGGQADVVILLPDLSLQGAQQYVIRNGEGFESVMRQFYVGVTRAKETLYLAKPAAANLFVKELVW